MLSNFGTRFLRSRLKKDERLATKLFLLGGIIIILLFANVVYLNITVQKKISENKTPVGAANPSPTLPIVTSEITATQIPPVKTYVQIQITPQVPLIKEYFVTIGTGTNQSSDWQNVDGATATINFGSYQDIQKIIFEASVAVPTANEQVWVRLYNVSDNHPVWNSDVMMNGGTSAYLQSQPITYDRGPKIYQVQMKTQLQYPANLTQSRIHIYIQ